MDTLTILQSIKSNATTEIMEFDETIPNSNYLLRILSQQRTDGRYCDATLTVNKTLVNVHQCIMAAISPYFNNMFLNMKQENDDSKIRNKSNNDIEINAKNPDVFMMIIDYVYTGQIKITTDNIIDVVDLATQLSISKLQDLCSKYLKQNINDKTCFFIHDLAKQHNLSPLVNIIDSYVFANVHRLIESDSILEVSLPKLELYVGRSVPLTELQRLDVICRWIEYKLDTRKDYLPILLKLVHWSHFSENIIDLILIEKEIFKNDEWMFFHFLTSLNNSDKLPLSLREKFIQLKDIYAKMYEPATKPTNNLIVIEPTIANDVADEDYKDDDDDDDDANSNKSVDVTLKETSNVVKRESARIALSVKRNNCNNEKEIETKVKKSSKRKFIMSDGDEEIIIELNRPIKKERLNKNNNGNIENFKRKIRSKYKKRVKLNCSECTFEAYDDEKMKRHLLSAHKDSSITFNCELCPFKCKWNRQFYKHLRNRHFTGPPYHCDKCGHTANSIQLLLLHRMDHTEKRPHICEVCGASFKLKSVLDVHAKTHTGEKQYKCPECDRSFGTKGTMAQHLRSHTNQRPFLCDLCGFSTKYQSHLKAHSRTHTGDEFHCQHPGCKYKTPKRSQLACHQRIHLGLRDYTCDICNRSFVEHSHLKRHKRLHSDDRPFACEKCNYASTRNDKLKEHQKKYHNDSEDIFDLASQNKRAYRSRKRSNIGGGDADGGGATRAKQNKKFIDIGNDSAVDSLSRIGNNLLIEKPISRKNARKYEKKSELKNILTPSNYNENNLINGQNVDRVGPDQSNTLFVKRACNTIEKNSIPRISISHDVTDVVNGNIGNVVKSGNVIRLMSSDQHAAQQQQSVSVTVLSNLEPFYSKASSSGLARPSKISIRPIEIDTNVDNKIVYRLFRNNNDGSATTTNNNNDNGVTTIIDNKHPPNFHSFSSSHYSSSSGVSNDPTGSSRISETTVTTNLMISPSTNNFSSPGNGSQNLELSPVTLSGVMGPNDRVGQTTLAGSGTMGGHRYSGILNKNDNSIKNKSDVLYPVQDDDEDDSDVDVTVLYFSDEDNKVPLLKIKNAHSSDTSNPNKSSFFSFESRLERMKAKKLVKERIQNFIKKKTDTKQCAEVNESPSVNDVNQTSAGATTSNTSSVISIQKNDTVPSGLVRSTASTSQSDYIRSNIGIRALSNYPINDNNNKVSNSNDSSCINVSNSWNKSLNVEEGVVVPCTDNDASTSVQLKSIVKFK